MYNFIGLLVTLGIWGLSFKPFFKNKDGFSKSIGRVIMRGRINSLKWDENVISDIKAAIKFTLWFVLGGGIGYLVIQLLKLL